MIASIPVGVIVVACLVIYVVVGAATGTMLFSRGPLKHDDQLPAMAGLFWPLTLPVVLGVVVGLWIVRVYERASERRAAKQEIREL